MDTSRDFAIDVSRPAASSDILDDAAEILICADGDVFTQMYDADSQEPTNILRAPAVPLALFLADNWWRLHFEPIPIGRTPNVQWRLHHELTAISASISWPPIMIYGTGEKIVFSPRAGITRIAGPSVYVDPPVVTIDMAAFDIGLDSFFAAVGSQWRSVPDGELFRKLLAALCAERDDAEIAAWRRLEARLGYNPDTAPETLIRQLGQFEEDLGELAVGEAAVAAPGPRSADMLKEALAAARAGLEINRDIARGAKRSPANSSRPAWENAEAAAAFVRTAIGVAPGPIKGKAFGDILGVRWDVARDTAAVPKSLSYGAVARDRDERERLAFRTLPYAASRRFELARALGDAVWDSTGIFAPLSHAKTERQKFQRAFAQSFLCPFDDLRAFIDTEWPDESHIQAAAIHFHVSEFVVRTLLVNKHMLEREGLSERLEAA